MSRTDMVLRIATADQAEAVYNCMMKVWQQMEDKTLFVCDSLEFVKRHISDEGFTVIACDGLKIAAAAIFRYPGLSEDNLGRDIGFSDDMLKQVVHAESSFVLPKYRGMELQNSMYEFGVNHIDITQYKYLMATISPDNLWSRKNSENKGFQLITTKEKYGGLIRGIYLKALL